MRLKVRDNLRTASLKPKFAGNIQTSVVRFNETQITKMPHILLPNKSKDCSVASATLKTVNSDDLIHSLHYILTAKKNNLLSTKNNKMLTIRSLLSNIISGAIQPSVPAVPDLSDTDILPGLSFLQRPKSEITTLCKPNLLGSDISILLGFTSRWTKM